MIESRMRWMGHVARMGRGEVHTGTDMTQLAVAFRSFANATKKGSLHLIHHRVMNAYGGVVVQTHTLLTSLLDVDD